MASFGDPRKQSVSQSHFAMTPRTDVPRSVFRNKSAHKTTFDAGWLVPVYLNEVLPGDTFRMQLTAFARMQTAIFPIMDNLYLDTFWFFVPNRLIWDKWQKFMGEQVNPSDSIDYTIPILAPASGGFALGSLGDFFGMPSSAQIGAGSLTNINALPFRAYSKIYDDWFRDENLQNARLSGYATPYGDGPDPLTAGAGPVNPIAIRGKRHDYFTSCLPWPQKTGAVTAIPGLAPIQGLGLPQSGLTMTANLPASETARGLFTYPFAARTNVAGDELFIQTTANSGTGDPLIYADLSQATSNTINALRQSFMMQSFLEKSARGGTRYIEILRSHFGVISPDARLQRPEYLGGNSTPLHINPVAQTSVTAATPLGNLAGVGTAVHQSGFSQSFTEHGYVLCIANVRADLTYQQGYHRLWSRRTRFDFYWPSFAHLGEQAVLRKEIYAVGDEAGANTDNLVFGYQERWAEYRYFPSKITGKFRSGIAGTLDAWHLAQSFGSAPVLGDTFIKETPPMSRILAAGAQADNQQFLFDSVFEANVVRPMPTYSVPGLGARF